VHLYDPHLPYVPPEPFASRFAGRPYDGEIAFMDSEVGRLLDALKRRTGPIVIAAVGDHGESLGEHGEEGHGVFLYQATQRVPMILAGPGVPMGKTVATTVGLIDLAPTLLELVGQGPLPGADGHSLVAHLSGERFPAPDYELETFYPAFAYGWSPLRALVSGPLWGRVAWGKYWTWDARQTTTLLLELLLLAYLLARKYGGPAARRLAAALALFAAADVPLVYASATWWRTLHPSTAVVPKLDPSMRPPSLMSMQ